MNTAAKAISLHGLKRRALSLGAVKTFDHAMQFLLPIVLVRCLDTATFGEYRLLWLIVGTLLYVGTLNMAGGLYFFLPRSEPEKKRLYIHQTWIYLAAVGLLCGLAVGLLNPLANHRAMNAGTSPPCPSSGANALGRNGFHGPTSSPQSRPAAAR